MSYIFFFPHTATTEIYTLSLHDALPISGPSSLSACSYWLRASRRKSDATRRSEEHTSELQSRPHLVCRLLLEKKKNTMTLSPIYSSRFSLSQQSPTID